MSDELDDIKKLLRAEPLVMPREDARRTAITAAIARFDEKNLVRSQGTASSTRLSDRLRGLFKRSQRMPTIRLSHVLMAGTSLAVLTLVVVSSGALRPFPALAQQRLFALLLTRARARGL